MRVFGYGKFKGISFENNNEQMMLFTPYWQKLHNHVISQPRFSVPQSHLDNGQVRYELINNQGAKNMTQNACIPKVQTDAAGVNTQTQDHKNMQSTPINLSQTDRVINNVSYTTRINISHTTIFSSIHPTNK